MVPNEMVQPHTKRPGKQERSGKDLKKKDCGNTKEN